MKRYKYFYKEDKEEEAVGHVKAKNLTEALKFASIKKRLPLDNFNTVFIVKEVK